jgi:hypothetical protein
MHARLAGVEGKLRGYFQIETATEKSGEVENSNYEMYAAISVHAVRGGDDYRIETTPCSSRRKM